MENECIKFATWLQDNYVQNTKTGSNVMLPNGYMREDFTNNISSISVLYDVWMDKYKFIVR